ncbi:Stk1 family PASTA domain-containing Ser/Thr kinase [Actinomyces israelii]|uniref:non-specific serine/threonine protein kinase n=1 Tax=Actinomyces israelii TaxID=1659 RepID=A0ABT4I4C9_9ACTO|nr:Stk1 family PASTA domain-containing Ser/Thr kinase [Actinomyces israelii]MCZ0856585.1 Stk1 family PASTA domain-containing Ser/Thr kinase [Actinomyces israelii]
MVKDPLTGRLVDSRYEIVDLVARGGMATVYRAFDRRLDRVVGLKLMHAHLADSPDFVARFRREARAAARLSNPGVVAVYDQGSLDGIAYLVMEYVEGPNLRDLMAAGPLSVREALGLTAQILRPLGAAHRAGLVHRDIKPENVLLPADGSVAKVADFGLARAVTEATQTTTGNVLGTVAYLAPELITSGTSSPRADLFSVGIIVYELLTGEQPFAADAPIQIAFRNVHEDIPSPSALVPDLPAEVDELVSALTQRDPELRPRNADEALALLRRTAASLPEADLLVKRGGGTGSVRTQEVLAANAEAARAAMSAQSPEEPVAESSRPAPGAGLRTVSLPIGSIGPDAQDAGDGRTQHLAREELLRADDQATTAVPRKGLRPVRRRTVVIGAAAALLVGGSAGGWYAWYVLKGPGRSVPVPEIIGQSAEDAQKAVEDAGLTWGTPSRDFSDTIPEGSVISCRPGPGDGARLKQAVTAVVSRGVEQKKVPDVAGKTQDEATKAITDAGLTVGPITQEYSGTVESGRVVSTDPKAGTSINHSSAVAIAVSRGRQSATVPDVTGMTVDQAKTTLEAAGLKLGTQTQAFSDTVASGQIISTSPAAGASGVYNGDTVAVTVSKGPENVTVPDVNGKSEEEAKKALEDLGLKVEVNKRLGAPFGTVRSTEPAAGTSVKTGSTVKINIF